MGNTRERPAPARFDRYGTSPRPPWWAAYGDWIMRVLLAVKKVQLNGGMLEAISSLAHGNGR